MSPNDLHPPSVEENGDALDAEAGRVFDAYVADLEAGRRADPEWLLAAHPHLADRLRACLDVLQWADRLRVGREIPFGLALGDFRVVREIGRGGMGVVYEAEQLSLGRRVALKVLPPGAAMDPKNLRRFQVEAHAVASLHHTNIVPIHAVGCDGGVPYYAMQLIEGQSLADLISELRSWREPGGDTTARENTPAPTVGPPRAGPSSRATRPSSFGDLTHARTVAVLGLQAAEALEHAHARGVLHRDIKPANLILDPEGQLWVTDFGLARRLADPGLTATGDLLGTVRYMSPEQARAARVLLDGRTDIYSLGVTLYELLTLRPAVEGSDQQELLRRIAEVEPVPPSRHDPSIPRDLETILLKAMAKDPVDRFTTARDLADDLRRFIDDQAIRARRPTFIEQVTRWVRRHATLVASALAALILVATILVVSVSLLWREQSRSAAAQQLAEQRRREARRAVDTMYTQVAQEWLNDRPKLEGVQRKFLEEAARFYDAFARETGTDPGGRREAALAAQRAGDIQRKLGLRPQALTSYRRAMTLLEGLLADSPGAPDLRLDLSQCSMTLGFVLEYEHPLEAENAHKKALSLAEGLVADFPTERRYLNALAQKTNNLGNAVLYLGRYHEAESLFRRCGDVNRNLMRRDPREPLYHYGAAVSDSGVGGVQLTTGHWREAESSLRSAIVEYEQLQGDYSVSSRLLLAVSYCRLGDLLLRRGDREGSWGALQKALELTRGLTEKFPGVPEYRQNLAGMYLVLGRHHEAFGHFREAEEALRMSFEIQDRLHDGVTNSGVIDRRDQYPTELAMGDVLTANRRPEEARGYYRRALESMRSLTEKDPATPGNMVALARFLSTCPDPGLRDPAEALRLAIRASQGSPDKELFLTTLGLAQFRAGGWAEAQRTLEKARSMKRRDSTAILVLAMACWQAGDWTRARSLFEEAIALITPDRSHDTETIRLRDEAASLLGL
jgi:serine/threonine protein kinase